MGRLRLGAYCAAFLLLPGVCVAQNPSPAIAAAYRVLQQAGQLPPTLQVKPTEP
ncbi:MAG: hypothetical protein QOJ65_664, partial [Fimbriimonadaceae bacterium]|nr:hypothetical protein [Fimbriimonadaceae bacterium]